ncbi:MAG: FmdB family zinc ribbon protein, partial [Acidimicrobiales bacterium]
MPTYEYRCKACGQDLEVVQAFTDDALTTCEACGGPLRKVFGNVGIAFKGSGFYKNDSRGKSSTTASGGDKGSDSSTSDAGSSTKEAGTGTKKDAA